jgi:23S rRNA pseudouridine2605 synthase
MPERKVYILLNKPKDYITTLDDPYAKKTVVQLVREACPERIYPVGRLDKNTTGVLLFTNDGELARKLTHPSSLVPKIYQVTLDQPLTKAHLLEIASGITLDDGPIKVDEINYLDESDKTELGVQLHSGRNRIVRRLFEHFGYKVKKLDRVFFAGLTKLRVPRGKWRFLSEKEISRLKMNIFS